ncbi:DUF6270 domain-containing protein [Agrococcus sp. BE272]|uniref:DUF6270 domain-containing protein n=1 Tax=Agrococcus sp. BE272 TaxID=2817727 RepID=UPI002864406E|nr:DUF6270 domain-containing protein [Agrococcus sp. BE272]MDR7233171.1 hypothetical protein [Agrococcus sp. BE272]
MSAEADQRRTRAFIYGSCVTRDTIEHMRDQVDIAHYVARQSWISAGTDAGERASRLLPIASTFQQRVISGDLRGNAVVQLERYAADTDIVIVDLVDERGGVIDFGDGFATKLAEYWSSGGREASRGATHIEFGTDEHFALWAEGAKRLLRSLIALELLHRTIVIRTPWAEVDDDGDALTIPGWMMPPKEANERYERYFSLLAEAGLRILELPAELAVSSKQHQWGTSPFHYAEAAYEHLAAGLRAFADEVAREPWPLAEGRRDAKQWGRFTSLASPAALRDVPDLSGRFTIEHGGVPIDLMVEDNGAETTLVSFHAALGTDEIRPPVFVGRAVSDGLPVNRVFVSDPGLLTSPELRLAWFLGTASLDLPTFLARCLTQIQARLGARHIALFGMSGGGFAALSIARLLPGSVALPINPQTRVLDYLPAAWERMAHHCYGTTTQDGARLLLEAHPHADQRRTHASDVDRCRVIYLQNARDAHVSTQMIPWFEAVGWGSGPALLLADWGEGHVPPGSSELRGILATVASADGAWDALSRTLGAETAPSRAWVRERTGR